MRVGIYIGKLDPQIGGESTFTRALLREIASQNADNYEIVFLYKSDKVSSYVTELSGYKYICINKCDSVLNIMANSLARSIGSTTNRFFFLDHIAEKENIDLFYFAAPVLAQTSYPYIFTVWDLGHRVTPYFPEVSRDKEWTFREKIYNTMLPRASYIITGNEEGKKELLTYYNLDESKIRVVEFPVTDICYKDEKRPGFIKDDLFFFYPAQFWPHKNHICIIEALDVLRQKYDLHPTFYFTGSDKGNMDYIRKMIEKYQLQDQVFITGFLSEEELKYMYTHAKALVFASLLGPNNLPPIEAIFLGCSVIISDIPGHKEQMGDAALYFDGYDPESLAEAINIAMKNKKMWSEKKNSANELRRRVEKNRYFDKVFGIFSEFSTVRKRWG